ncbi:MAG: hypothetical protein ACJAY5_001056 [Actinomycetes bacterium]
MSVAVPIRGSLIAGSEPCRSYIIEPPGDIFLDRMTLRLDSLTREFWQPSAVVNTSGFG